MPDNRVDVLLRDGKTRGSIPADKLQEYIRDYGVSPMEHGAVESDEKDRQLQEGYGDALGMTTALGTGLASGITWGGSDIVQSIPRITALFEGKSPLDSNAVEENAREQRRFVAANPGSELVGQLAGGLVTGSVVEDAAKFILSKAAAPAAALVEGISPTISSKILRMAAKGEDVAKLAPTVGSAITPRIETAAKIVGNDLETGLPNLMGLSPGEAFGGTASMQTVGAAEKLDQLAMAPGGKLWMAARDVAGGLEPGTTAATYGLRPGERAVGSFGADLEATGAGGPQARRAAAAALESEETTAVTNAAKAVKQTPYRGAVDLAGGVEEGAGVRKLADILPDPIAARMHSPAFQAAQKIAASATSGAFQGVGTAISDDLLGPDHHITASHLLYGAALGGGAGVLVDIGLGKLGKLAKGAGEAGIGAAASEPIGTRFAKFLRDSEADSGIAAVTKGKGVAKEAIEDLGGAAGFYNSVKNDYLGEFKGMQKLGFGSPEFAEHIAKKLAGYESIEQETLAAVSKLAEGRGQLPTIADVTAPFNEAIQRLSGQMGREGDAQALLGLRNSMATTNLVSELGASGTVDLGKVAKINVELNNLITKQGAKPQSVGSELIDIRRKLDALINTHAGQALEGDAKLAQQFVATRERVMTGRAIRDALAKAEGGAEHGAQQAIGGMGQAVAWAAVTGHPGIIAGALFGNAAKYVMKKHGDILAAELFGKAAQLAGIDAGAKAAEIEVRSALRNAVLGTERKEAAKAGEKFDADAVKEMVTKFQRITPEENARRTMSYSQLVGADAPRVAASVAQMVSKTMNYLQTNAPKPLPIPRSVGQRPVYAIDDLRRWHEEHQVLDHPPTFTERLHALTLTKAQAQAVKNTNPVLFATAQDVLIQMLNDQNNKVPYERRFKLGWLLEVATDPTLNIQLQLTMQKAIADVAARDEEEAQNASPARMRDVKIDKASSLVTPSDSLLQE